MRKFLIPLLMAGAMMPATAFARPDRDQPDEARTERASEDRPQRAERTVRVERAERPNRVERAERPHRIDRVEQAESNPVVERRQTVQAEPTYRERRIRQSKPTLVDGFRAATQDQAERNEVRRRDNDSFTGIPHRRVDRGDRRSDHRWSSDWRRDHRYNWRSHRDRHRSLFRLGRYYDPYGWGYRRFSIGFSLGSGYYGSNYWLDDPWMYRLPPAYGPYRWVRYYDDALLVNIYTGQVVDVLHNFFW